MENMAHFCTKCGTEQKSQDDRFCGRCGAPFDSNERLAASNVPFSLSKGSDTDTTPLVRPQVERQRQRHLMVVGAMTFLTFGLYMYWWIGATWAELKRELRDEYMHPFWHALSLAVPIYGLFKFYDHFHRIDSEAKSRSVVSAMSGWLALICLFAAAGINIVRIIAGPSRSVAFVSELSSAVLVTYIVVRGQAGLNDYWRSFVADGRVVPVRTHWLEWVTVGVGALMFLLFLVGSLG